MKIVECWKEPGVTVPKPYERNIKVLFAPDKEGVNEVMFTHAIIYPHSATDMHMHDRPELIYIVSGRGKAISKDSQRDIQADVVLWVEAGELHQMVNSGDETLKLATVFIPPYLAQENYDRCVNAAKKVNEANAN